MSFAQLNQPSLQETVDLIASTAKEIQHHLAEIGENAPSFASDGLMGWPSDSQPNDPLMERLRSELVQCATDLLHLAIGPNQYIKHAVRTVSR